ncbi:MAG: hypothetical protein ACRCT7_15655 [Shewanella sp.]|uniref:hypothetical protein n=1 Tax=Shewanella sp. SNU WT4 TaxID=2590015 RepID=UPI0011261E22|nr:hypothetical protein [Shewanella sp. SNU WT4]QDF68722.1 hypothetical protein FJQ87_18635 [Shewanella sp. SNU WT4]
MKPLLTVALLCAPLTLSAAQFERESVRYDDNGKPIISAQLKLAPINARVAQQQTTLETVETHWTKPALEDAEQVTNPDALWYGEETLASPVVYEHTHFIHPDEHYFDAMNRWLARDGFKQVAWSLDSDTMAVLNSAPAGTVSFAGSIRTVMKALSRQLGTPFEFVEDNIRPMAALHQFHGRDVQIAEVKGASIQEAIASLATEYQWNWHDDNWRSPHNYTLTSSYPIVTPKGDINRALTTVLKGYPVDAQLLNSTRTLFITAQ